MNLIKWTSITKAFIVILGISGISALINQSGFLSWLQMSLILLVIYVVFYFAFSALIKMLTKNKNNVSENRNVPNLLIVPSNDEADKKPDTTDDSETKSCC